MQIVPDAKLAAKAAPVDSTHEAAGHATIKTAPGGGASAEPLGAGSACSERFTPTCSERFSEAVAAGKKSRKPAASSKKSRPYHSALEKALPGVSSVEVWSRLGFDQFKTKTRFSNRPAQPQLALLMLEGHRLSPLTHEITLTLKPGSRQTNKGLLHRLRAYCREHAGQSLSYVGVSTYLPYGHGHYYLSLVKGTRLYDAVMDFVADHAGLPRDEIWFPAGKDKPLKLGLMQKLRDDEHHAETGLPGALGKIGYALHHFDDVNGIKPEVEVHASKDFRALARRVSKFGFGVEPQAETSTQAAVPAVAQGPAEAIERPLNLGPPVADEEAWRRHTNWDRLFDQESAIMAKVAKKLIADGVPKPLAVRRVLDGWFRHHRYEAGAVLPPA